MTVETATQFSELDPALPAMGDLKREAPQHFALVKTLLQDYLGSIGATPLTVTGIEVNYSAGLTGLIQGQLDALDTAKADKSGATYTGTHDFTGATTTAATPTLGDSSTKVATTAFVASTALASTLPGQTGNERKWIKTDGTTASWQYLSLDTEVITVDTVAVPGKYYVIATQDITLTIPATFNANEPVGFGMSRGLTRAYVDWTTNKLKGRTPGVMTLQSQNDAATVSFANTTDGFVEA
jgi:hypothetical protein